MRMRSRSPGKWKRRLARASLVGDADVHEADWLFRRAAAGPGNSGDAHAERRARSLADSVGESQRHFRAYCAFGFDQLCGNIDQRVFSSLL